MKIIKNIEDYLSFINHHKGWFIGNYRKVEFINASKSYIFNNSLIVLKEILFPSKYSNNVIDLESFLKLDKISNFFLEVENLKTNLEDKSRKVKNKVTNNIKNIDKSDENILNNILYNLVNEITQTKFDTKRIINDNEAEYIYIFSRLNDKQKENLKFDIDKYYKKVDEIMTNFKNKIKI